VLALNLATSAFAPKLGLVPLSPDHYSHLEVRMDLGNPLRFWTFSVSQLVMITQSEFLAVYKLLIVYVNELFFKGQLVQDSNLWFAEDLHAAKTSLVSPVKLQSPSTCNSTPVQSELY
jgi:hypothetical protein